MFIPILKCFQYLKSSAKQKVSSKSHYNKTGGGKKKDNEIVNQTDEQLLDLIGRTEMYSHDCIKDTMCFISFLNSTGPCSSKYEHEELPVENITVFECDENVLNDYDYINSSSATSSVVHNKNIDANSGYNSITEDIK